MLKYEDAICDLKVALDFEGTCGGKRQIENDLKLIAERKKTESSFRELTGKELLVIGEAFIAIYIFMCLFLLLVRAFDTLNCQYY